MGGAFRKRAGADRGGAAGALLSGARGDVGGRGGHGSVRSRGARRNRVAVAVGSSP